MRGLGRGFCLSRADSRRAGLDALEGVDGLELSVFEELKVRCNQVFDRLPPTLGYTSTRM